MDYAVVKVLEEEQQAGPDEDLGYQPSADGESTLPLREGWSVQSGYKNQILILVSAPLVSRTFESTETEISPLAIWQEILSISGALKKIWPPIEFEIKLVIANANDFRQELFLPERPLIIHFIGHGMNNPSFRGLIIEDDIGRAKRLDEVGLNDILTPLGRPPCLMAILNACHSEILSQTLIDLGVRFVISINADDEILDEAAKAFTKHFYPALLNGALSVRQAFEMARGSLRDDYPVEVIPDPRTYRPAKEVEPVKYRLQCKFIQDEGITIETEEGKVVFPSWEDGTNLSIQSQSVFLGRQRDILKINKEILLKQRSPTNKCLVIHGMPGMGKTELAKAVGRWQYERRRFDDGVWFVSLRNVPNASLAWDVIQNTIPNLPILVKAGRSIPGGSLISYQALIILDDLDQLLNEDADGCYDLLNDLLAGPGIQVLVTSREDVPLDPVLNYSYHLNRLDDLSTIKIFKEYAHLHNPTESLARLVSFFEGYPFPVRLAAAYMKTKRLSVTELSDRVRQHPDNVMHDPSAKPSRDTVLSITLDLSYQVLPQNAKEMLHILSIFPSGMTKPLAKYIRDESGVEALEELLSYSMAEYLYKDPIRFALPEPARQYALKKGGENLIDQYGQSALQYFEQHFTGLLGAYNLDDFDEINSSESIGPKEESYSSVLDEASNLREFLEWGYREENSDQSICYSARLTALLAVNYTQLPESEKRILLDRLEKATIAAKRLGDTFALARVLQGKGEIYLITENLNGSLESYLSAKENYQSFLRSRTSNEDTFEDLNLGAIYYKIGDIYRRLDQTDKALSYFKDSIVIFLNLNSLRDAASAYRDIGHMKRKSRDFRAAFYSYKESLDLFLKAKDYMHAGYVQQRVGDIQREQGKTEVALESYKQAARHYHDGRGTRSEGLVLEVIGDISNEIGLYTDAEKAYREAINRFRIIDESLVLRVEKKLMKFSDAPRDLGFVEVTRFTQRKSLKEEIFEVLHKQIIAGQYEPGDWLRQEDIASQMGVSMTPVRDALDLLVAAGLAERVPYRGVRVREMSPQDIVEAYGLRLVLEPVIAREAAKSITPQQVSGLEEMLEEMKRHETLDEVSNARRLSREFHSAVAEASGNMLLVKLYGVVANAFPDWLLYEVLFRKPELLAESMAATDNEHKAIVDALKIGNEDLAVRRSIQHVMESGKWLEEYLGIPPKMLREKEEQISYLTK